MSSLPYKQSSPNLSDLSLCLCASDIHYHFKPYFIYMSFSKIHRLSVMGFFFSKSMLDKHVYVVS